MLVFDVGMHNGDDTAYYLSLGHRVVAIEANPALCDQVRSRFRAEIAAGRLVVEQVAIAPTTGEAPFFVTVGNSQFSALDRAVASHGGRAINEIAVRTVAASDLFDKHGVPFYLKIDIERGDSVCLDALKDLDPVPRYVSVEAHSLDYLCRLWVAGYRRFKIIDQLTHNAPRQGTNESAVGRLSQTINHYVARMRERRSPGHFPPGSSGPFSDDTPGEWQDLEAVAYDWLHFHTGHSRRGTLNSRSWFDFHAAF